MGLPIEDLQRARLARSHEPLKRHGFSKAAASLESSSVCSRTRLSVFRSSTTSGLMTLVSSVRMSYVSGCFRSYLNQGLPHASDSSTVLCTTGFGTPCHSLCEEGAGERIILGVARGDCP